MMSRNPFTLVRAADFSDEQINALWVELGAQAIDQIIEPREPCSKLILGGKGAGKTHLLRYHSYPAIRLREKNLSGLEILRGRGYLAVFLRATGIDAARFEAASISPLVWQHLFGIYLELQLGELVADALSDVERDDPTAYDFQSFLAELVKKVDSDSIRKTTSMVELKEWFGREQRLIDIAINNAAFSGTLDIQAKFAIGSLCLPMGRALSKWHPGLAATSVIYLIDEIENFSSSQQQVVNSLIRYGGGQTTFRISGRLYAMETFSTLGNGEVNREGAEYKITNLDEIMRKMKSYPAFASKFISSRMASVSERRPEVQWDSKDSPKVCFEEIEHAHFFEDAVQKFANISNEQQLTHDFRKALTDIYFGAGVVEDVIRTLTAGFPVIIGKLNVLLFCKKFKTSDSAEVLARNIRTSAISYISNTATGDEAYANAYGHWAQDLFAQVCHDSNRRLGVPYAGLDTFIKMSSGNPRNLLIVLGRAYAVASFKGIDFMSGGKLPVELQTEAVLESAQFMYESDTNFGSKSDSARQAASRLGDLLRTARFSLNIPEKSPVVVSFSDDDLTPAARETLMRALNYSFVFEIMRGRPDRNSKRRNRKVQLNPLLAPRWELSISRGGDLSLSAELANSIFDPYLAANFESLLRSLESKWQFPFAPQEKYFKRQGKLL